MKKNGKKFLALSLATMMAFGGVSTPVFAAANVQAEEAIDQVATVEPVDLKQFVDENTKITEGWGGSLSRTFPARSNRVNENYVCGYYTYTLDSGRTIKYYSADHTPLRAYMTVIAVPNGTEDVYAFLQEQGWIDLADKYGEQLFVLEPKDGVWGTPEEEQEYLEACLGEGHANDAYGTRERTSGGIVTSGSIKASDGMNASIFSVHASNYFVGYGEGCALLEDWTSYHSLYAIGQAFIGGETLGADALNENGTRVYNGINDGSFHAGYQDEEFLPVLEQLYAAGEVPTGDMIVNKDIAIPTLLAGYAADDDSVNYWKEVNDVLPEADENGTFYQSLDSNSWQTQFTNSEVEAWGWEHGISSVKVSDDKEMSAEQIRDFLAQYTRYTTQFAYGNTLGLRLDYYETAVAAKKQAEAMVPLSSYTYTNLNGEVASADLVGLASTHVKNDYCPVGGTLYVVNTVVDGGLRENLMYVPDCAKAKFGNKVPVVVVNPGSGQQMGTFIDASQWWAIANDEGCAVIILGQGSGNANTIRSSLVVLENAIGKDADVCFDMERVYASGHSAGCNMIQTLTHTTESFYFAGVGATSFPNADFTADDVMPSFLAAGQADISEGLPNPLSRDVVKAPWDKAVDSACYNWINGCMTMNGDVLDFEDNNHDSFLASCLSYDESGRFQTYTWGNKNGTPLVSFIRTMAREHNCIPKEFRLAWDFLEHYSVKADGSRYYSASAFKANDLVSIKAANPVQKEATLVTAPSTSISKVYGDKKFDLNVVSTGDGALTYASSNEKVATVSAKGIVKIKGTGITQITVAAAETKNFKAAELTITLKVAPKQVKIKKVAVKKQTATVTLQKDAQASGYEVQISANVNFAKGKTTTITLSKNTKLTATAKNLKKGTAYIRARSYKKVDGAKLYGKYSKVSAVTVK